MGAECVEQSTSKTRVVTHPRRTLGRSWHRHLQLHLPLKSLASPSHRRRLAYSSSGRAVLWVGFLACESARVRAWPPIASRPRPFHFTVRQLNCTRVLLSHPAADLRLFYFFSLFTLPPRATSDPRTTTATHRHNLPNPLLHNGSAQLILPARAVLCPYAGPLIDHQRASTLEHPTSRPSPTVSDDSSSYHFKRFCCNAELIREELKASVTFPPGRKVLTCASTSPTTPRPCVRCLAKRRGSAITGLRSCESGIL